MAFIDFIKELRGNKVEGELVKTLFISLASSAGIAFFLYISYPDKAIFFSNFGFSLLFLMLSYSIVLPAICQIRAYKIFPCMSGMMIGMTIGMIVSFLTGFYVAMTNGMFVGGFFGVFVGVFFGIWMGKSCGIMGIMEGIMVGFMGGLMGAMTAFMLLNDNLQIAGILVFIIGSAIMIMLNYMIYSETINRQRKSEACYLSTVIISAFLMAISGLLILYGPRSLLFQ